MEPRTLRQEIIEVVESFERAGLTPFAPIDVVRAMAARGSRFAESSVRTHVVSALCANAPVNHAVTYDDLVRVGRGQYRLRHRLESEPAAYLGGSVIVPDVAGPSRRR